MRRIGFWAAVTATIIAGGSAGTALAAGDAAAGQVVFKKCAVCHSIDAGVNKVGPSLHGVVGRKSATAPGYDYSAAMKGANKEWTAKELDTYLTDPRAVVPGTKMVFVGLKDQKDRDNVIAYLETLK
ncbi:cytochrome c family protein [Nitrospirillum sp. BR 11752]|uniref:c-type cytochrome n=1 Tax=Nitrospirillum sp. BR 11752 TaxID=3104293 RepID=UPI002E9D32A5|nr:cytochrome c family protein [Nitrospirillum sp. BR 11752]